MVHGEILLRVVLREGVPGIVSNGLRTVLGTGSGGVLFILS